jgi:cytochrome c-type biogenesis protein
MVESSSIGYGAAFLGGLLSFFSPCVLPLLPVYLSLITGVSVEALESGEKTAFWPAILRTLLFVAGFSLVFTALGAGAGTVGQVLREHAEWFRIGGGILVIVFGLHFTGVFRIAMLYREARIKLAVKELGAIGTFLMGMTFALGWTPCIGPWLASILAVAATEGRTARGIALLLTYSAGMGVPFLLAAALMGSFLRFSGRMKKILHHIEVASGILLILLGVLLLTNRFSLLAQFFSSLAAPEAVAPDGGLALSRTR